MKKSFFGYVKESNQIKFIKDCYEIVFDGSGS